MRGGLRKAIRTILLVVTFLAATLGVFLLVAILTGLFAPDLFYVLPVFIGIPLGAFAGIYLAEWVTDLILPSLRVSMEAERARTRPRRSRRR